MSPNNFPPSGFFVLFCVFICVLIFFFKKKPTKNKEKPTKQLSPSKWNWNKTFPMQILLNVMTAARLLTTAPQSQSTARPQCEPKAKGVAGRDRPQHPELHGSVLCEGKQRLSRSAARLQSTHCSASQLCRSRETCAV